MLQKTEYISMGLMWDQKFDYEGTKSELKNMFYVEVTEHYFDKKEKCL